MFRVLVANPSDIYLNLLQRHLKGSCQLRACADGAETLAALGRFQPDILLLQAGMPHLDGLRILQQSAFIPRVVLVQTQLIDRNIRQQMAALGVRQLLVMPTVSMAEHLLRTTMDDLSSGKDLHSPAYLTAMRLHGLRFQPHLDGYRQLCVATPFLYREPELSLTKELYPAVAKALDLPDWRSVEHSIRKSICDAWERRDNTAWSAYFPEAGTKCPSNKQFLTRLAQLVNADR